MEKINIAELLKDCPTGMELDCTMYDNCTFEGIEDVGYINILVKTPSGIIKLSKEGCFVRHDDYTKCIIFPKGKTTWKGFVPPCKFKNGDIIYNQGIKATAIFCKQTDDSTISHCFLNKRKELKIRHNHCKLLYDWRLAAEEEIAKLFDVIKANGYKWNFTTKTLEKLIKPEFKVGDRIKRKGDTRLTTIKDIRDNCYIITFPDFFGHAYITDKLLFSNQNEYELLSDKFDITSLKPFDKVLVRGDVGQKWTHDFFGFIDKDKGYPFVCVGHYVMQCIPYEGNEHLLGKTNDCDKYYRTWS